MLVRWFGCHNLWSPLFAGQHEGILRLRGLVGAYSRDEILPFHYRDSRDDYKPIMGYQYNGTSFFPADPTGFVCRMLGSIVAPTRQLEKPAY